MKKYLFSAVSVCLGLSLSACQLMQNNEDNRAARCKEMKSRMILSGSPMNPSTAFEEREDQAKLNQSFHDDDCT
jgi:lipid-binding SYLF domain-containing protein